MKSEKPLVGLVALSEKPANQHSYRLIEFYDCNVDKFRKTLILSSDFLEPRKVYAQLIDQGLQFPASGKGVEEIIAPLKETPKERVKLRDRPGYFINNKKLCYLTNNGKTLGKYDGIAPMPYPESKAFANGKNKKGTLADWQTQIASSSVNSPYIMIAICSAFAGYCIFFTDIETGGLHLFGESSKGKSTALLTAASVCGNKDYVSDWNITEAALEELAESRNHGLLILDEVSLLDRNDKDAAQKMQKIVYMLCSEGGKQRSSYYQARKAKWQLNALSNGELGLNEQATMGKMQRNNGEKVRFIDIPVDCGNDLGIFKTIPDGLTPSEYAEKIKSACRQHYGIAGPEFVKRILDQGREYIKKQLKKHMNDFLLHHNISGLNGIEKRIANRFALTYASGVLAVEFGVLPFTVSDVMEGVSCCYRKATDRQKKPNLNAFFNPEFKQEIKGNVINLNEGGFGIPELQKNTVIETHIKGEVALAIESGFFKKSISKNNDFDKAVKILKYYGVLILDSEKKSTRPVSYNGKSIGRRYCMRKDRLLMLLNE